MYIEALKFSLWADFIERDFIHSGLKELIRNKTVNGATSNPAIFKSAILTSPAYKAQLATLGGMNAKAKYEALAISDIQAAADVLRPLYDAGDDGYVSIEVDPNLCDDAEGTIEEGKRLHTAIGRPNVMIKVPATGAGYMAMEALTAAGIPVNATLVFSKAQAISCAEAFARAHAAGHAPVDTVISIFVSRIDRALDKVLAEKGIETGKAGVYNAAAIYAAIEALAVARCRTLFASTGVKGDDLRASYYVEELLAYNSVNTAPIATIDAYVATGVKEKHLPIEATKIEAFFAQISEAGIDFDAVIATQISEGLFAFKEAFAEIIQELE